MQVPLPLPPGHHYRHHLRQGRNVSAFFPAKFLSPNTFPPNFVAEYFTGKFFAEYFPDKFFAKYFPAKCISGKLASTAILNVALFSAGLDIYHTVNYFNYAAGTRTSFIVPSIKIIDYNRFYLRNYAIKILGHCSLA
jgi:hypothetical protein